MIKYIIGLILIIVGRAFVGKGGIINEKYR